MLDAWRRLRGMIGLVEVSQRTSQENPNRKSLERTFEQSCRGGKIRLLFRRVGLCLAG